MTTPGVSLLDSVGIGLSTGVAFDRCFVQQARARDMES
jgi:hypothetical protein